MSDLIRLPSDRTRWLWTLSTYRVVIWGRDAKKV
jgi:hypothetical protein